MSGIAASPAACPAAFPAATVVICRDISGAGSPTGLEVLLLQRAATLKFGGSAWVFPGGRVDPDDFAGAPDDTEAAVRRAAARECAEEAGLQVDPATLVPCAHWTTPVNEGKRFATWFFIATGSPGTDVVIDDGEIVQYRWLTPAAAIAAQHDGSMQMMPPTYVTLLELAQCDSVAAAVAFYRERPLRTHLPKMVKMEKTIMVLYEEDAGYASADPAQEGPRHRTVMTRAGWQYFCEL
jgi:8-oxo-dGTP pyrophosphatase MutT (NUDIX family)